MSLPKRVQLRRTKGWRKPEGAIVVARPSKWGNPWVVHEHTDACDEREQWGCPTYVANDREGAVTHFRHAVLFPVSPQPEVPTPDEIRTELAGKDLACWCPLNQPCHADFLLEIANGGEPT